MGGVPVYQIVAHIIIAAVLLMAVIYVPLLTSRDIPRWMTTSALCITAVLVASATFAVVTGLQPNLQFR